MQQLLKNKTILVTRSKNQTEDFIHKLEKLGAKTIVLPLIKNRPINETKLFEKVNNNSYNWIIFTSPNAVEFFFKTVSAININSKIAVVGSKTSELIKKLGLSINFIPSKFTAKQLAKEIPITKNDKILIPRSSLAKNDIVEILEQRNCTIETLIIYKNTAINYSKKEMDTVFNQHIDFITFTSGSTVRSFMKLGIEITTENIVCIGPETAQIIKMHDLPVSGIANPHTIKGLINVLIKLSL